MVLNAVPTLELLTNTNRERKLEIFILVQIFGFTRFKQKEIEICLYQI